MGSFGMFDFTPVGLAVAATGVVFVALLGWRIVPAREQKGAEGFDTGTYLTEVRVTEKSGAAGKTLREAERMLDEADAQIVGLVRNDLYLSAPNPRRLVRPGDILVLEAEPESLSSILSNLNLVLEEHVKPEESQNAQKKDKKAPEAGAQTDEKQKHGEDSGEKDRDGGEPILRELVVMPNSLLIGRSASDIHLRTRHSLNLLAISHQGRRSIKRLRSTPFSAGDVLLMQGAPDSLAGFAAEFGCIPLAARSISIPNKRKASLATIIMIMAIGGAAFGLLPAAIAFATGVLMFMLSGIVPLRRLYEAIDWPVIVLLAALIPVALAMESTGSADLLARSLLENIAQGRPVIALLLVLVVTMTLSDFMNNAATAAVMCPISISIATQLGVNADSFLMAVAIGASCAFLTPIGHQNNTLILGPGGFRFGDYWRMGLPMEILVAAISIPMLLIVWPL